MVVRTRITSTNEEGGIGHVERSVALGYRPYFSDMLTRTPKYPSLWTLHWEKITLIDTASTKDRGQRPRVH